MKIKPNWERPYKARSTRKFCKDCENMIVQKTSATRAEAREMVQAMRQRQKRFLSKK